MKGVTVFLRYKKLELPTPDQALPGRVLEMPVSDKHVVLGTPLKGPWPAGLEVAVFGMGCFWGAERIFWQIPGVYSTSVGYAGGFTANPTYEEVCSGATGHAEVVQLTFDPRQVSFRELLEVFFTIHDPTTLNRQGADVGTQYRSAVFYHSPELRETAHEVIRELEEARVWDAPVVTEVVPLDKFYPAEEYHQEYFRRNPVQPYCRVVVAPKVSKFRRKFIEKLKKR